MRKLTLIGLLVVLCEGCGRSWLPLRGGSCRDGGCLAPAPQLPACNPCANTSGYAAYDNEIVSGDSYYGGNVIGGEYYDGTVTDGGYSNGTIVNPPMTPVAPST